MHPARIIVIDEDLPQRLRTELWNRGRTTERVRFYGLSGSLDPALLPALAAQLDDCVLVTGDDKMPLAHAAIVASVGATIATVEPRRPEGVTLDAWRREVVHRWAHKIHEQRDGEVRRYSYTTHRIWTPRM